MSRLIQGAIDGGFLEGQEVNMQKLSIFFRANTSEGLQNKLVSILGMPQVMNPVNYLGIPTTWSRSKREALAFVKDRAGIEVFIKAVSQAIPAYPMNIFCFLNNICNDIDVAVANFLVGERKIHWVSRETLGLLKQDEARKGGRSSWAWASLLAGRDIIANGAYWKILNGEHGKKYR
ncbi:hypothetical protein TB2_000990 [Malus domestica]